MGVEPWWFRLVMRFGKFKEEVGLKKNMGQAFLPCNKHMRCTCRSP